MNKICKYCGKEFDRQRQSAIYCSKACFNKDFFTGRPGKKQSKETIKKRLDKFKGFKHSEATKKKLSELRKANPIILKGKNNPMWKGGISTKNSKIRNSLKYREWRLKILEKYNNKCILSEDKHDIEIHHLDGFNTNKEKRFDLDNGIPLRKDLHKLFHKLYLNGDNTKDEFKEFLNIMNKSIRIYNIIKLTIVDGDGLRFSIYFQGCSHKCDGCHNIESWDYNGGIKLKLWKLILQIMKSNKFIDGISLSGGEPLDQPEITLLCKILNRRLNFNIWLWTGYKFNKIKETHPEILSYVDTIIDGCYHKDKPTEKPHRGSDNQVMWKKEDNKWKKIS